MLSYKLQMERGQRPLIPQHDWQGVYVMCLLSTSCSSPSIFILHWERVVSVCAYMMVSV